MSPERSSAYRRVMKTLEDMGPSKLLDREQQRIRYAADNLIFSNDLAGGQFVVQPGSLNLRFTNNHAPAAAAATSGVPHIAFSALSFDFGKVLPTDKPQHDFIFTNTGNAVLLITEGADSSATSAPGSWPTSTQS